MLPVSAIMMIGSAVALGLVMCLHLPTLPKHWLLDLGVPWFFFASGFWFAASGKGFGEKMRDRVRSLLVPYFLWNLIWFPLLFACNWLGWRFCGATRAVDGSWPCLVRCLGLSPFAWPALVPTWFLRALFAVAAVVGGLVAVGPRRRSAVWQAAVCAVAWGVCWAVMRRFPEGTMWHGFFVFGLSLPGCAWFATGMCAHAALRFAGVAEGGAAPEWVRLLRRQLMPVYVLHAAVIVAVGRVAKTLGLFGYLATAAGDVAMWFVGIAGSVAIGAALRRHAPRTAKILFGGR